jgi:hypothetical protein
MCLAYAEAKSYILVSQLDNEMFSKYVEDKEAACDAPGFRPG